MKYKVIFQNSAISLILSLIVLMSTGQDQTINKKKGSDTAQQSQEIINSADSTLMHSKRAISKLDSLIVQMEKMKNNN